eukprot:SAG22_NODE_11638_length_474_cov_0.618037_1_plen_95_part_10
MSGPLVSTHVHVNDTLSPTNSLLLEKSFTLLLLVCSSAATAPRTLVKCQSGEPAALLPDVQNWAGRAGLPSCLGRDTGKMFWNVLSGKGFQKNPF